MVLLVALDMHSALWPTLYIHDQLFFFPIKNKFILLTAQMCSSLL
jgi:hypothetical protein